VYTNVCDNLNLSIFYKKKQIPSEQLYRAHIECVSQWQGMWLYVETCINMKICNMNDVLYDKWKTKIGNLHNLNTKHTQKKEIYKEICFPCA
jgi:hypothetical protein